MKNQALKCLSNRCDISPEELTASLAAIDYHYRPEHNQFS
ncbi:MAG: DUF4250 domain-containing protein [Lachnospiraceae bacterium]|nr:DUF4250 domain-containing protein [Lachnospiraceae bacterium]